MSDGHAPNRRPKVDRFTVDGMSVVVESPQGWDHRLLVILAHGAGNPMDSDFMQEFATEVVDLGAVAVRFNFPYMEAGRRAPDPAAKLQAGYQAVVAKVEQSYKPEVLVIGGKSMGGRIASMITKQAITKQAITKQAITGQAITGQATAGQTTGEKEVAVSGLVFLGYPLHPPGRPEKLRDRHLYALECPMLFVSGTRDNLARLDLLEGVVGRLGTRARLVTIDGGDHSFKRRKRDAGPPGTEIAREAVRAWLESYR